ncbi:MULTISPECIES: restriction endonuclease subunit S [unclassified Roseofilum]|uniref:restriction endonuclease subunit S n=1 Tax=unclassified Roseofilum TaxID=2620099 RepID=UPI001B2F6240|nr:MULTISPECIES: restriction endonuclease subunit S [unclassified Roseofilum]MBP0011258.1 restriction endonuclease subunit S [Roseofilum sp. Belize Diploria]MBP0032260.1 restriction endonuclease subunit S [Roseofilum sp. Belize BBD 4]
MKLKFSRYDQYKDSGIEWIGEIPEHWEEKRIKDLSFLQSGINITSQQIEDEGKYPVYGGNGIRGYFSGYTNDGNYILIGRQGALCGNINHASGKFWATEHAVVVYHNKKIDVKWYGAMLQVMNLNQYSISAAQPGLAVDRVKRLLLPVPPLHEQEAIAHYLDTKTAQIDRQIDLLTQKAQRYEELKRAIVNETVTRGLDKSVPMKDSGIEWIGDIPEHWKLQHLKNVVSIKITDGPHETPTFVDHGVPFISAEAVQNGEINFEAKRGYISEETDKVYSAKCKPKKDDIFIVKSGSTTGKIGYVSRDINFNIWSPLALIRASKQNHPRYLFYFLSSIHFQRQVQTYWSLGTQPNIGMKVLENLFVLITNFEDQKAIADYLDTKTAQIDQIIQNINTQVEKLQELRKTLINDVVTGKIKVI